VARSTVDLCLRAIAKSFTACRQENPEHVVDQLLAVEAGVTAGGHYFVPPIADPTKPWN
jgi:hypothetical protein